VQAALYFSDLKTLAKFKATASPDLSCLGRQSKFSWRLLFKKVIIVTAVDPVPQL